MKQNSKNNFLTTWLTRLQSSTGLGSLLVMLILFRLSNALLCRSLFVPDEHWQSLEIAYNMVFNYIHTRGYVSWEWHKSIRGYTHPLIFATMYKILSLLHLDHPNIMAEGPRILQSVLASTADLYVYKTIRAMFDHSTAKYGLLSHLFSWFTFYCSTRTLSNSIETSLTPIILYYWLQATPYCTGRGNEGWNNMTKRYTFLYLSLCSLSVIVRPTGAILFAPLFLYQVSKSNNKATLLGVAMLVSLCAVLLSSVVDRYFYGKWVFTALDFVKFNVFEGGSALFGVHPWHWYFTQGLPTILFTSIPFLIHGVWLTLKSHSKHTLQALVPFFMGAWLVFVHSLLKHKEFRFVQPVIPLVSIYIGVSIKEVFKGINAKSSLTGCRYGNLKFVAMVTTVILFALNVPMSAYFCLVHQRGGYAVMDHLRYEHVHTNLNNSTILFLMPCHSTPLYSLLHTTATLGFLRCTYKWNADDKPYQEDYFYSDPVNWINKNIIDSHNIPPTHLIIYDVLYETIKPAIDRQYQITERIFHTHFRDNERVGGHIYILKRVKLTDQIQ